MAILLGRARADLAGFSIDAFEKRFAASGRPIDYSWLPEEAGQHAAMRGWLLYRDALSMPEREARTSNRLRHAIVAATADWGYEDKIPDRFLVPIPYKANMINLAVQRHVARLTTRATLDVGNALVLAGDRWARKLVDLYASEMFRLEIALRDMTISPWADIPRIPGDS